MSLLNSFSTLSDRYPHVEAYRFVKLLVFSAGLTRAVDARSLRYIKPLPGWRGLLKLYNLAAWRVQSAVKQSQAGPRPQPERKSRG